MLKKIKNKIKDNLGDILIFAGTAVILAVFYKINYLLATGLLGAALILNGILIIKSKNK